MPVCISRNRMRPGNCRRLIDEHAKNSRSVGNRISSFHSMGSGCWRRSQKGNVAEETSSLPISGSRYAAAAADIYIAGAVADAHMSATITAPPHAGALQSQTHSCHLPLSDGQSKRNRLCPEICRIERTKGRKRKAWRAGTRETCGKREKRHVRLRQTAGLALCPIAQPAWIGSFFFHFFFFNSFLSPSSLFSPYFPLSFSFFLFSFLLHFLVFSFLFPRFPVGSSLGCWLG